MERATGLEPAKSWLGKLIPYPIFRDLNYPSDLAVLKTNTVILANVLTKYWKTISFPTNKQFT